jgi:hypothetical protein
MFFLLRSFLPFFQRKYYNLKIKAICGSIAHFYPAVLNKASVFQGCCRIFIQSALNIYVFNNAALVKRVPCHRGMAISQIANAGDSLRM